MRRSPRPLIALASIAAAAALVACTPEAEPTPTATETADAPRFASEEEALAAAEQAYGAYLSTMDDIFADGGQGGERLLDVASREIYDIELPGFAALADNSWRGTGRATATLSLQQFDDEAVWVYVCEDHSATDIVDTNGVSVRPPDAPVQFAYESELSGTPLVVQSVTVWTDASPCE